MHIATLLPTIFKKTDLGENGRHFFQRKSLGKFHAVDSSSVTLPYPLTRRYYSTVSSSERRHSGAPWRLTILPLVMSQLLQMLGNRVLDDGSYFRAMVALSENEMESAHLVDFHDCEHLNIERFLHFEAVVSLSVVL